MSGDSDSGPPVPVTPPPLTAALTAAEIGGLCVDMQDRLRAFLLGLLRNSDLAAEALQSALGKAVEKGSEVERNSFQAWLFRVAYNEAMLIRRRRGVDARALEKLAWISRRSSRTAEEELLRREETVRVRQALAELPLEQQTIVRLRIDEDKTFAEIAESLSLPLGTVLTRMRLALKKLYHSLRPLE